MVDKHRVAGVILASGMSRRFGESNKLLLSIEGEALVRRTARVYLDAGVFPVVLATGYEAEGVRDVLADLPLVLVDNPAFEEGQSRALVRGVGALPGDVLAAVIGVADQPFLTTEVLAGLVAAWRSSRAPVVAPRYGGERGNPILYSRELFPELLEVIGDQGGRPVFRRHESEATFVDFDAGPGADIDTPEDYRRLMERF